jgi:hypothetical protein
MFTGGCTGRHVVAKETKKSATDGCFVILLRGQRDGERGIPRQFPSSECSPTIIWSKA